MIFHIRPPGSTSYQGHALCGLSVREIYETLDASIGLEVQIQNRPNWFPGDSVCLDCVRKARPAVVKQIRACQAVKGGEWVVLCGCGGVRPYGKPCGSTKAFPEVSKRTP